MQMWKAAGLGPPLSYCAAKKEGRDEPGQVGGAVAGGGSVPPKGFRALRLRLIGRQADIAEDVVIEPG